MMWLAIQVKCISWCIRGSEAGVLFEQSHEAALRIHKVCVMVDDFWCDLATLQAPRMVLRDVLLVFQGSSLPCLFDELNLGWGAS